MNAKDIAIFNDATEQQELSTGHDIIKKFLGEEREIGALLKVSSGSDVIYASVHDYRTKPNLSRVWVIDNSPRRSLPELFSWSLASVLRSIPNVRGSSYGEVKNCRAAGLDIRPHLAPAHFARYFNGVICRPNSVSGGGEGVFKQYDSPDTGPGGDRRENRHDPLRIPVAKEHVLVRADGVVFLYLLLIGACISIATTCVLCLVAPPNAQQRDKHNRRNKKP